MAFHHRVTASLAIAMMLATTSFAQVGGTPGPPTTIWNFMGIPQGVQKVKGAVFNRRGNHPFMEPKPPLKALADPANLESPDAAIKKAAEIKMAEDLKKQKIKAIKYLASIGCGCYDADGGVTDALAASMTDCTEDVRYEAVSAIADAAQGGCCSKCGSTCCCNKKILMQLASTAYDRDDHGCYLEPSERVRQAAAEALRICCPNTSPPIIVASSEPEEIDREQERETTEGLKEDDSRESVDSDADNVGPPPEPLPPGERSAFQTPVSHGMHELSLVGPNGVDPTVDWGAVVHVSTNHRLAHVHFGGEGQLPAGCPLQVYRNVGDEIVSIGQLSVVETFPGSANVTGTEQTLQIIQRGDVAVFSADVVMHPEQQRQAPLVPNDRPELATDPADSAAQRLLRTSAHMSDEELRRSVRSAFDLPGNAQANAMLPSQAPSQAATNGNVVADNELAKGPQNARRWTWNPLNYLSR